LGRPESVIEPVRPSVEGKVFEGGFQQEDSEVVIPGVVFPVNQLNQGETSE